MKQVLKFAASWCQPCKALSMMLENQAGGENIEEIDIDKDMDRAIQYQVRSVPTMIMLEDGKEIKRKVGLPTNEELTIWLNE